MLVTSDDEFCFHVSIFDPVSSQESPVEPSVPQHMRKAFAKDGFVVIPDVLDRDSVDALNFRLEEVLRGRYDRHHAPDKRPRLIKSELISTDRSDELLDSETGCADSARDTIDGCESNGNTITKSKKHTTHRVGPLGFSGNINNVRVLQIINVHKSDRLFRILATNRLLGKVVAELAGWTQGARLAQDQVWAKPPGAAPLAFHRDSPYFMFIPSDVVTVWFALDDMDEELGPIEYVRGSHLWGDGRWGSSNQFFEPDGGSSLLRSTADRAGVDNFETVSMAGLGAGGISIHDGRTWHGSGKNESRSRPRRGLGLHFVPAEVKFTIDAEKSRLWKPYVENVEDVSQVELLEEDFPLVWQPPS